MPVKTYTITISDRLCKQCGICIEFCPREVFTEDEEGQVQITNPNACTGCLICELMCPELAITIDASESE